MTFLQVDTVSKIEKLTETLFEHGANMGLAIIKALIIFVVGRLLISLINKVVKRILTARNVEPSVNSFVRSLVNVVLLVLLLISVVGALGVQTTSFAALLASAGVAIGMALSGNLSNFAGGLIILIFKPFKVGDYITAQNTGGTVTEIQIFHTILNTPDNIRVYIPNGALSSSVVSNFNVDKRRIEWTFGVDYGVDYEKVKKIIENILAKDTRILPDPAPFTALNKLDASSVNVVVRVWVNASDYWGVYFDINKNVYDTFNAEGIDFPFPQMTVHQAR